MSKDITVSVAGSGELKDTTILPGTIARDVLNSLGLGGYKLARANQPPFAEDENIFPLVSEGEKLFASTKSEVASTGTTPVLYLMLLYYLTLAVIMVIRRMMNRIVGADFERENTIENRLIGYPPQDGINRESPQRILVKREEIPYWQERKWKKKGETYNGYYRTMYESKKGLIINHSGFVDLYIFDPPSQLWKHPHWQCFRHRGGGKYLVHFGIKPKDVSSGIIEVERILNEAYRII